MIIKTKRSIQWIQQKNKKYAGLHLVAEFWCGKNIDDEKSIRNILLSAAREAKSTPLEIVIHKFNPQGITGVILLAESHIALHMWPELDYLAIDIFTCGDKTKPYKALNFFKKKFKPRKIEIKEMKRGRIVGTPI